MNYERFWNQFLLEAAETTFDLGVSTVEDPPQPEPKRVDKKPLSGTPKKPKGINAYLANSGVYIEEIIGKGADGFVYRAVDEDSGKKFAIKVIAPSTAKKRNSLQSAEREVQNYKFLMDNRKSFGEKAKYFPVVYKAEYTEIPKPQETIQGEKEKAGIIFMEELVPLPDDLLKKLFAASGPLKGKTAERRDKILFNNETIVKNFLKTILEQAKIYTNDQDKTNNILNTTVKNYQDFSKAPSAESLMAVERETSVKNLGKTRRKLSKYGIRLMATLIDSLVRFDMQPYESRRRYIATIVKSLGRPFLYNYSKPLKTTDSYTAKGSVFVGFDEFDEEGYIDQNFPEAAELKDQVSAFEDLGIGFKDVHSGNVMMRPGTNDIVIMDVGRFRI